QPSLLEMPREEFDRSRFGPVWVVTGVCDEAAVAAVRFDSHGDERIDRECGRPELIRGHERVVRGCYDERWNSNAIDDAHGAGFVVVVAGAVESVVRCRIHVVELPNRPDAAERREVVRAGPECGLAAHASA